MIPIQFNPIGREEKQPETILIKGAENEAEKKIIKIPLNQFSGKGFYSRVQLENVHDYSNYNKGKTFIYKIGTDDGGWQSLFSWLHVQQNYFFQCSAGGYTCLLDWWWTSSPWKFDLSIDCKDKKIQMMADTYRTDGDWGGDYFHQFATKTVPSSWLTYKAPANSYIVFRQLPGISYEFKRCQLITDTNPAYDLRPYRIGRKEGIAVFADGKLTNFYEIADGKLVE